ncbi:hypothetical protein FG386_000798 [Cryptosporidium ryanae]|uniref:uncharacterized protein n=1 Tax=Cryptosporidium ryanae TaxID=515981 RepID=UPI00351A6D4D|nr:hypothetical protein FG386_000798 [Cryptosporidium ryanae]
MTDLPISLKKYIEDGKKTDEVFTIYRQIITWLDSDDDYYLVIGRLTQVCSYILKHIDTKTSISNHLNYVSPDILSIVFDKSSKILRFPNNCYSKSENPFYNERCYSIESNFWELFRELSIKISQKCPPKECYVIFVEIILGSVTLPITSEPNCSGNNCENKEIVKDLKLTSLYKKSCELPRFFRYLGLHCSILCISRMKRNKAQFLATVCSLTLRKLIYDTDCNSLYICSCAESINSSPRYCIIAEIRFLEYLLNDIIHLLLDCLSDSKYDAEYKNQEIGIFNSDSHDNNINVTQHTIYSFLMKTLEKLILIDVHDIEILHDNSNTEAKESNGSKFTFILSHNYTNSIINKIFPYEIQNANHNLSAILESWITIIFKLCYYISNVSPQMIIDILSNIPICITDVESQPGDLDVTPLSLSCYSYSLFVILEQGCQNLCDKIYPKQIISLPSKLNIIFRTVTTFLIYCDSFMYGYELNHNKEKNEDILLSYFNTFLQKSILAENYYIRKFHMLIQNRLQEKAYYLLESNLNNLIYCKELIPDSFRTIYGLNWHQNILIKHVFYSFTRYRNDSILDSKTNTMNELYPYLFEKLIYSLKKCYDYDTLFNLFYNNVDFHRKLALKNHFSGKVIVGLMSKMREILWEEINTQKRGAILSVDLNKTIAISLEYLFEYNTLENDLSQGEVLLIVLNFIKLILLSEKKQNNDSIKQVTHFLTKESNVLKNYIEKIKKYFENKTKAKLQDTIFFVINDIENIIYSES